MAGCRPRLGRHFEASPKRRLMPYRHRRLDIDGAEGARPARLARLRARNKVYCGRGRGAIIGLVNDLLVEKWYSPMLHPKAARLRGEIDILTTRSSTPSSTSSAISLRHKFQPRRAFSGAGISRAHFGNGEIPGQVAFHRHQSKAKIASTNKNLLGRCRPSVLASSS